MIQAVQERFALSAEMEITEIVRVHYDSVFRFCARRVGLDDAEDAAQDTFITANKVLKRFRGESSVRTWLFGIAHNECRRVVRKRRGVRVSMDLLVESGSSPEGSLISRESLRSAMMELTDDHREAVVLVELDGLTYDEAAAILGVPAGTVKSRIHYAFQNLRKSLMPNEVGH